MTCDECGSPADWPIYHCGPCEDEREQRQREEDNRRWAEEFAGKDGND